MSSLFLIVAATFTLSLLGLVCFILVSPRGKEEETGFHRDETPDDDAEMQDRPLFFMTPDSQAEPAAEHPQKARRVAGADHP